MEIIKKPEELLKIYKDTINGIYSQEREYKTNHKKVLALGSMWLKEKTEQGQGFCRSCRSDQNLTVDHIIPVALLEQFGFEPKNIFMPENYDILCRRCNMFKANRLDFSHPKAVALLKGYVSRL